MRVLVISNYSETLIMFRGKMLEEFKKKGHDVFTLAPDYHEKVKIGCENLGVSYDNYYLDRTGTNLLADIKGYFSLKNKIRSIQPDVVLSYTIKPVIYGSLAAKSVGVDSVNALITGLGSTFNNSSSLKDKFLNYTTNFLYKIALSDIEGVIFQNTDDREIFINRRLCSHKNSHRIHGTGVDLNDFALKEPVKKPIRFLFMGRLLTDKGLLDFVEAAKIIRRKYPESEFHILGRFDTNPNTINKSTMKSWTDHGLVQYHGEVEDVRPYIEKTSVFVLPSYREGTPRTALESMAIGRPLIMTDVPGCRETVKDGVNGFLVPVKDPKSIAEKMERFIKNPEMIEQMGAKSREFVEQKFDVRKVNSHIMEILNLN